MLNLFCIKLYITFGPNHWLEVHKCPYLQNCIQGRCWNTELSKSLLNRWWKSEAATQSEDADAKTQNFYTIWGRICRNTEQIHSSGMQMLKHEAVTLFRSPDAETQRTATMLKHEPWQLEFKADTVKGTIHVAETAHELRCWNSISSYEKELLHQP